MLLGLHDDYSGDGRALIEAFKGWAVPPALRKSDDAGLMLAHVYKQLTAPVGQFGLATLGVSTRALESSSPGDSTYTTLESQLSTIGTQRDALASQMLALLEGAEFKDQSINPEQATTLASQGLLLLKQVATL